MAELMMASRIPASHIRLKRAYEPAAKDDGLRILVDRLWPRGLSKDRAALDEWLKDVAPSDALRKWFHHDPTRWAAFRERYLAELQANPAALDRLRELAAKQVVTLIYGARDQTENQAVVLRDLLTGGGQDDPD